jgi:hypothetical protein
MVIDGVGDEVSRRRAATGTAFLHDSRRPTLLTPFPANQCWTPHIQTQKCTVYGDDESPLYHRSDIDQNKE